MSFKILWIIGPQRHFNVGPEGESFLSITSEVFGVDSEQWINLISNANRVCPTPTEKPAQNPPEIINQMLALSLSKAIRNVPSCQKREKKDANEDEIKMNERGRGGCVMDGKTIVM